MLQHGAHGAGRKRPAPATTTPLGTWGEYMHSDKLGCFFAGETGIICHDIDKKHVESGAANTPMLGPQCSPYGDSMSSSTAKTPQAGEVPWVMLQVLQRIPMGS